MSRQYNKRINVGTAAWWQKWTRFDPETGCVLYTGFVNSQGYALVHAGGNKKELVHRLAYRQVNGPIAPGVVICHRCDTPNCCNPAHLFAGTQKDNLRDMFAKGRARPQGRATAPLTVFPAVSGRVRRSSVQPVAEVTLDSSAQVVDFIHLIGTTAIEAPWCRVTGVPSSRPTQAIVLYERPELRTVDKVPHHTGGASAAPYCATQRPGGV